mmetsp:Transcript_22713/g.59941  ORF Transcript_22713/g.59941 Transcript_22713/m.59941 type:complete len:122 (-) Transcript_22713:208-573(-)
MVKGRRTGRCRTRAQVRIARGRFAKVVVMRGSKSKTSGGLTKLDLIRNKRGRIVSRRASEAGKKRYLRISRWISAVQQARRVLNLTGFIAINSKSLEGAALYCLAKELLHINACECMAHYS